MQSDMGFEHISTAVAVHTSPSPCGAITLDLEAEINELHHSPEWANGIARKVLVRCPDVQVTLRAMKADTLILEHSNPNRVCIQTIVGHIRMNVDGKLVDLPQGKMLLLDGGITHDVQAQEESAFLLTVFHSERRSV